MVCENVEKICPYNLTNTHFFKKKQSYYFRKNLKSIVFLQKLDLFCKTNQLKRKIATLLKL